MTNLSGYEALEYSFVADFEGALPNMIAHGYVLVGDVVVYVQHTSDKVGTYERALDQASAIQKGLIANSAESNLRRFKKVTKE